jgi:NitT/TauT family transport system substrate-binding protein
MHSMAQRMMLRKLAARIAVIVLAFTALGATAETVKIGHLGIVADAPFYLAIENGYFKEAGVDVELERFNSAAQATAPLSQNQVQVVGGGMSAALFNAFGRGWPVRIAIPRTRDVPGYSSDTLILRSDLRDSVKGLQDLKGKKIAVNAPSGALHYMVAKMLESANLKLSDIDLVVMPWPNMGPALETKAIDAGAVVEPFAALYNEKNIAFPFRRAAQVLTHPYFEVSVILFNSDWSDRNPDQARAFTVAYLRGARDYYEAMRGGPNRKHVVDVLIKYTTLKDPAQYDKIQWEYVDPNIEFNVESMQDQEDWYAAQGAVTKKVPIESMIDRQFVDYAIGKLGRIPVK